MVIKAGRQNCINIMIVLTNNNKKAQIKTLL